MSLILIPNKFSKEDKRRELILVRLCIILIIVSNKYVYTAISEEKCTRDQNGQKWPQPDNLPAWKIYAKIGGRESRWFAVITGNKASYPQVGISRTD